MRLDLLVFALSAAATIMAACLAGPLKLSPGLTAVSLTYIMQLAGLFQYVVRMSAEVVNFMTSAERLAEFAASEAEDNRGQLTVLPLASCMLADETITVQPEAIRFENVSFRWRPELPLVLCGVTFTVLRGQKCAVVGRTGAGKSTLAAALFRLAPISGGTVYFNGISVHELRLTTLRRSLAVLPQTPTLFAGTVRFNLDPVGRDVRARDKEMTDMLQEVGLLQVISSLPHGIDTELSDDANLSAGEKQLLCLARALLMTRSGASVLLMDEATSSCDDKTDLCIQQTLARVAGTLTSIVIAHRLKTIAKADLIVSLDAGRVVAIGPPEVMLVEEAGSLRLKTDVEMSAELQASQAVVSL